MALESTSPMANLYLKILGRLKTAVPDLRYIDQDLGQLENYDLRPPVSWPCCLIDIEEFQFSDIGSNNMQEATGIVSLRIGLVKYTESNNLVPDNIRPNAMKYYETEQKVYEALQGWEDDGFSRLLRRGTNTERREDDIRVRVLKFAVSWEDDTASPKTTKVSVPVPVINSIT